MSEVSSPDPAIVLASGRYVVDRARADDVPALVALLRDDPLGASREPKDLAPYERAFVAIDADPDHRGAAIRSCLRSPARRSTTLCCAKASRPWGSRSSIDAMAHILHCVILFDNTFATGCGHSAWSVSCRRTLVTVLHQDIGDTSGCLGGDTSAPRLRLWLPGTPSIPVSVSRSRSGPMTPHAGRSRRSAPSTASHASRSTNCANARLPRGLPRCSNPGPGVRPRARQG